MEASTDSKLESYEASTDPKLESYEASTDPKLESYEASTDSSFWVGGGLIGPKKYNSSCRLSTDCFLFLLIWLIFIVSFYMF